MQARIGLSTTSVRVWDFQTGAQMNEPMSMEGFINDAILGENQVRRARQRRSVSPIRRNGAFELTVNDLS